MDFPATKVEPLFSDGLLPLGGRASLRVWCRRQCGQRGLGFERAHLFGQVPVRAFPEGILEGRSDGGVNTGPAVGIGLKKLRGHTHQALGPLVRGKLIKPPFVGEVLSAELIQAGFVSGALDIEKEDALALRAKAEVFGRDLFLRFGFLGRRGCRTRKSLECSKHTAPRFTVKGSCHDQRARRSLPTPATGQPRQSKQEQQR